MSRARADPPGRRRKTNKKEGGIGMNEFLLSLLPDLIGSLVGALVGFLLGMLLVKNARIEDEEERKEDIIKSLIAEIIDNKRTFDKGLQSMKFSGTTNVYFTEKNFTTDAFDSTVFSGGYQLLTVETQRWVTWFFNCCKKMNLLLDRLRFCTTDVEARYISPKIEEIFLEMKEGSIELLSKLQEELGYNWTITLTEEKGKE